MTTFKTYAQIKPLYSLKEVSEIFDVAPNTVRKMIRDRQISAIRVGGRSIRIAGCELDQLVERQLNKRGDDALSESGAEKKAASPTLRL